MVISSTLRRRRFLTIIALNAATGILAACSKGTAVATISATVAPTEPATLTPIPPTPTVAATAPTKPPTITPVVSRSSPTPRSGLPPSPLPTSILPTPTPDADLTFARLSDQVRIAMRLYQVPGVAVGLLYEGQEHTAGFGVTNIEHPVPVDSDTLFLIGSISKTYTGSALMRLIEMGHLDLHAPMRTYLPDLKLADEETAAKITIAHLVTHSGGWYGDFFADTSNGDDALTQYVRRLPELPQLAPLGYLFNYSNAGMSLAGRVIEVLTGKPFEDAIADLILKPLRARNTFYFLEDVITRGIAVGHTTRANQLAVVRPYTFSRALHPAAGVIASLRDVLDFARLHLGDGTTPYGERILATTSLMQMHTRLADGLPNEDGVAVNWLLYRINDTAFIYHDGAMPGQDSFLLLCPSRQFALVILTNAATGNALYRTIMTWARQTYLGLTRPSLRAAASTEQELKPYVGRYSVPGRLTYDVGSDGQNLTLRRVQDTSTSGVLSKMGFYDKDRTLILDGTNRGGIIDFPRTPDNEIGWIRIGGRVYRRTQ